MRQANPDKASTAVQQRCEQAFPGLVQLVQDRPVVAAPVKQLGIPEDAQVPTDPSLLPFGYQAQISHAQLAAIAEQGQQDQARWVAQSLPLPTGSVRLLERQEPFPQSFRLHPAAGDSEGSLCLHAGGSPDALLRLRCGVRALQRAGGDGD